MTSSSSQSPRSLGTSPGAQALAVLAALTFIGCSSYKNRGEREQAAQEAREEAERLDAGPKNPAACIRTCAPDPGSNPVDCAKAEEGIEFMDPPLLTFEEPDEDFVSYGYTDGSAPDPYNERDPVELCGKPTRALHLAGGPFLGWGGGAGVSIKDWWTRVGGYKACTGPGVPVPCEQTSVLDGSQLNRTVDASQWDGISLWARRGPESQAGFRVTVGDKYTDDDLNIEQDLDEPNNDGVNSEQRYCKRVRECDCPSNRPCNEVPDWPDGNRGGEPLQLCWDPRYDSPPVIAGGDGGSNANTYIGANGERYYTCAASACNADYPAGGVDPPFNYKACTNHNFLNGQSGGFCFNPGEDPPPAEGYERCGDHWQTPVRLSTDWQLFLVPFSSMLQQGYGKESPRLLTDQLTIFRLTWEGGWVDYYVDNVRFYRVAR